MAKHPTSSRVHRDSKQGPDDAFIGAVERSVAWARKNQRALMIGGVALIVLVAAALWYVNAQRMIENQASAEFATLQSTIASGNTQLALRDLEAFVNRYGSSETGEQARLILAELRLQQGEPTAAIEALGDLPDDLDTPLGVAAARVEAAAHEALGQPDQAVDLYLAMAGNARFDFERREAFANAARVRFQTGNAEAAATLYQRVVDTFEETEPGRGYYAMWLAEARARAASGVAAPAVTPAAEAAAGSAGTTDPAAADTSEG